MRVMVVGQGYVGLTTATGLVDRGHTVVGVERDTERLAALRAGVCPVYEPGLQDRLSRAVEHSRLSFTSRVESLRGAVDAVIVAVHTPPGPSGEADVSAVEHALEQVLAGDHAPDLVVNRSTIPPGTGEALLARSRHAAALRGRYVYSPEFFSQGSAIHDWHRPTRIVAGLWNSDVLPLVRRLFQGISAPWIVTTPTDAEMIKYASNAFLATKISFINEIANLCDRVGATIDTVIGGMQHDPRIGALFWRPGVGYGDSCLPKDTEALIATAAALGYPMRVLRSVQEVNLAQGVYPVRLIEEILPDARRAPLRAAVLGLCYEPYSDDLRAAPSRRLVHELRRLDAEVRVWDALLGPDRVAEVYPHAIHHDTLLEALTGAEVAVVLTEYPEVVDLDWRRAAEVMTGARLVIDAKNCLDPGPLRKVGLSYRGVGRPSGDAVRGPAAAARGPLAPETARMAVQFGDLATPAA